MIMDACTDTQMYSPNTECLQCLSHRQRHKQTQKYLNRPTLVHL